MSADSVSMPTLTGSRKCYSKQIMLNSVSLSFVQWLIEEPWPKPNTAIGGVSFQCTTGIFWAWLAASAASELHTSAGSLLHRWAGTCCALPPPHLPTYGMVQRKGVETQQASHEEGRISLLELLCFSAKAVAFVPPPVFISICFCSSISHTDKGKILNFWSVQYLYMKLLICFCDQAVILSIQ